MSIRHKILNSIDQVPSLSPTVSKVIEIANQYMSSPKDLMYVIKLDPMLTAKVLKLINSAFYGLPNKVTRLDRAIILLGIVTIKNLALSAAITGALKRKETQSKFGFNFDDLWRHSLATAASCKMIASIMKIDRKFLEEYFISGLLHDIGKFVFLQYLPFEYSVVLKDAEKRRCFIYESEKKIFSMDHQEVGALLAEKWKFSDNLIAPIKYHHNPEQAKGLDINLDILNITAVSNLLAIENNFTFIQEPKEIRLTEKNLLSIGLTFNDISSIIEKLPEEIKKAAIFLQIEDLKEPD